MSEQSRKYNLYQLLVICRKNKWAIDTPDIAGKLEGVLASTGYTERTIRDYVRAAINILESEKKHRIDLVLKYERENLGAKWSADKTAHRRRKTSPNPIYSSAFPRPNDKTRKGNPESVVTPNFVYIN